MSHGHAYTSSRSVEGRLSLRLQLIYNFSNVSEQGQQKPDAYGRCVSEAGQDY